MKITYIVGVFPKLSETFVLSQIAALIERGHEVDIISLTRSGEEKVHDEVVKYDLIAKTHFIIKNSSYIGFELTEKLISSLIFTDIIHSHFAAEPTNAALKLSRVFNIPYVFTAHAYDLFINPDATNLRERCDLATRIITVSDYNKKYLLKMLGDDLAGKMEIIRYGIKTDRFKYVARHTKDRLRILLIGRFVEKKGIPFAIEGFAEFAKQHDNAELRIIGDGALRDEIVNLISKHNLTEKVILLGDQPQSAVIKEMDKADIYLLPSVTAANGDSEGVPVSLMEAMATGLPVVSTYHTGIPELVADGESGFLVPEKDAHAIADRLKRLAKDGKLRTDMGRRGRKMIEEVYSYPEEINKLEGLFTNLLEGKSLVSSIPLEQRAQLQRRIADSVVQIIGQREEQTRKFDDKLRSLGDLLKTLGDVNQKNALLQQKELEITRLHTETTEREKQLREFSERLKRVEGEQKNTSDALSHEKAVLAERNEQLKEKISTVDKLQHTIAEREGSLHRLTERLSAFESEVNRRKAEIDKLQLVVKEREGSLHRLTERLSVSESEVSHRKDEIGKLQSLAKERDESLQALNHCLQERDDELRLKGELVQQKDEKILQADQSLRQKDDLLRQRDNKIWSLDADIKRKNDELLVLRKWLGDITASFPYKIFKTFIAPIRDILKKKSEIKTLQSVNSSGSSQYTGRRDQLVFLPDWSKANPYQKLLYDNISRMGTPCSGLQGKNFSIFWLFKNRKNVHTLHFHWLFGIYDPRCSGLSYAKAVTFLVRIMIARLLRYRFFWTVHNFISHESSHEKLECIIRKVVARYSDAVIVHCLYAKKLIMDKWGVSEKKIRVIPHGSYLGYYPNISSSKEARAKLNLKNNDFVFLFFGMVRKYKGLNSLVQSFRKVKQQYSNAVLLVAGQPHSESLKREIESLMVDEGISLFLQFIPDSDVQYFMNAADVVVLPYVDILTSGTALLAFTFGKPVIAPRKGCLPELITEKNGYLYDDGSLIDAMRRSLFDGRKDLLHRESLKTAEDLSWKSIVDIYYYQLLHQQGKKPTILIITNYLPQFDRASGCFRLYNIIKGLIREYNVVIYAEWFHKHYIQGNDKYVKALQELGVEVHLPFNAEGQTKNNLRKILSLRPLHAVIIEFFHITNINIDLVREYCPNVPVIVDSVDVRFHRLEMMADILSDKEMRKKAQETKEQEILAYSNADNVWAISTYDRDIIRQHLPKVPIDIVPNLHPIPTSIPSRKKRKLNSLIFIGGFNHPPNTDAILYFHNQILPLVRKKIPEVKLLVIGDSPPEEIQKLQSDSVNIVGYVPETKPYLDESYISIVPLRFGAGMKGKVGEALAHGLPVVTTSIGAQGMGLRHQHNAWIADSPEEFALGIVSLCKDNRLYDKLSKNGRDRVAEAFSAEAGQRTVSKLLKVVTRKRKSNIVGHV
jgi:glycosyltransferase involved in cell wall biosynthesis